MSDSTDSRILNSLPRRGVITTAALAGIAGWILYGIVDSGSDGNDGISEGGDDPIDTTTGGEEDIVAVGNGSYTTTVPDGTERPPTTVFTRIEARMPLPQGASIASE